MRIAFSHNLRLTDSEEEAEFDTAETVQAIADGLRVPCPGEITFPIIQRHVERVVLVSEEEIRSAVKFLLIRLKILVEPSGAATAAAALFRKLPPGIGRVGLVLSGGNLDFELKL